MTQLIAVFIGVAEDVPPSMFIVLGILVFLFGVIESIIAMVHH